MNLQVLGGRSNNVRCCGTLWILCIWMKNRFIFVYVYLVIKHLFHAALNREHSLHSQILNGIFLPNKRLHVWGLSKNMSRSNHFGTSFLCNWQNVLYWGLRVIIAKKRRQIHQVLVPKNYIEDDISFKVSPAYWSPVKRFFCFKGTSVSFNLGTDSCCLVRMSPRKGELLLW